ncbi:type II toxin-antitoxin system ParD family antitoxin [Roseibium litorale]|uniref:Type II toxin-antitoxin system ParD family antitoxin n=1 Tax=Roseibium litorale TaxID=2803841 RepID=A0ABR9CL18_9HYPH|nr:type II toxin-antitoxin system ParD family antitoxin [Roseibium litorale]MBD8891548.1 type II toxin-antitoxin system ParD family antitoxin [Roseibium litorale]
MATMNVSLPHQMKAWVEKQTGEGRYANSSDYVRDLIRKDYERQSAIQTLQAAISDGAGSGAPQEFNAADFKKAMLQRHAGS